MGIKTLKFMSKKIMFNDKYRLTEAVLDGRKTQTRRIAKGANATKENARYKVGEVVAIAQRYSDIEDFLPFDRNFDIERGGKERSGWNNKMFVKAIYMPHHIRITDVRIERLQDISYEDCIAEGITRVKVIRDYSELGTYSYDGIPYGCLTAKIAFSDLIDKISGKGTWDANPFVYVYEFELVD